MASALSRVVPATCACRVGRGRGALCQRDAAGCVQSAHPQEGEGGAELRDVSHSQVLTFLKEGGTQPCTGFSDTQPPIRSWDVLPPPHGWVLIVSV